MRSRRSTYPRLSPEERKGDHPENAIHTARIAQFGKEGDWASAWDEFTKVVNKDNIIYSSMMTAADRCGRWAVGRDLYEEMRGAGHVVTERTYLSAMQIFARLGHNEKVFELWEEMQAEGKRPTPSTFTILMSTLASMGDVEGVKAYFTEMQEKHKMRPNQTHYGCLLKALRVHGDADKAMDVLDKMLQAGVQITMVQYTLVAGCCRQAMAHGEDLVEVRKKYDKIVAAIMKDGLTKNEYFLEEGLSIILGHDVNAVLRGEAVPSQSEQEEALQALDEALVAGVRETALLRATRSALARQSPSTADKEQASLGRLPEPKIAKLHWRVERKLVGTVEEFVFYDAVSGEVATPAPVQGWASVPDAQTGRLYFWNVGTGQTTWALPE